jgi:outer membrane protein assembly factor BamB
VIVSKVQSVYEMKRSVGDSGFSYILMHGGTFVAQDQDGKEFLRYETGDDDAFAHCETDLGEAYIVCRGGWLWHVDKSGKLRWKKNLFTPAEIAFQQKHIGKPEDAPSISAPLVDWRGYVYVLLHNRVVAYQPDGTLIYSCALSPPPGGYFMDNLVVGFQVGWNGTVFVATSEAGREPDDGLRIISPEGKMRKVALQGRAHVNPHFHHELVIDEHMGKWTAHDYNWRTLWQADVKSSVIKFSDYGAVCATTVDGSVVCYSAAGKLLWTTWVKGNDLMVAGGDRPVYVLQGAEGKIVALDWQSGKPVWETGPTEEQKAAAVESQFELMQRDEPSFNPETDRFPFALVYLYEDCNGRVYFEGTANWLFATDEH